METSHGLVGLCLGIIARVVNVSAFANCSQSDLVEKY